MVLPAVNVVGVEESVVLFWAKVSLVGDPVLITAAVAGVEVTVVLFGFKVMLLNSILVLVAVGTVAFEMSEVLLGVKGKSIDGEAVLPTVRVVGTEVCIGLFEAQVLLVVRTVVLVSVKVTVMLVGAKTTLAD